MGLEVPSADQRKAREREIFLGALEYSEGDEQTAFVERACDGDRELACAVMELLRLHRNDSFLDSPAATGSILERARHRSGERAPLEEQALVGSVIDRYKILELVGEGGCGVVYMAEQQEPVRRKVALKVIKLGMDTRSVVARFEAERQALALMEHPNIARVLDGGSTNQGRPYFVMELVRGLPITQYCESKGLNTVQRLQLFLPVCMAIQHAHQKGIIHRDLKPSNILVTLHDGVPVPKVIDFGIAKALDQQLTNHTVFTGFQAFLGTPAYTSPEQAELSGLDLDTRTDVYSLGVVLYEIITGQPPFDPRDLAALGFDEMRRVIRETEPDPPSTRLRTLAKTHRLASQDPGPALAPAVIKQFRNDLDWIVMKCLEKDRTRRYPTVNALASDIQLYLANQPVTARPPSAGYRLGKFVRRNRLMVGAATVSLLALLVSLVLSNWQAVRAKRAEREQARMRVLAERARARESTQRQRAELERAMALRRAYNSEMNLAQQALMAHNRGRVVDLLERQRPRAGHRDLRQWEWRYFWAQSRSEAEAMLPAHAQRVAWVGITANQRYLASSDESGDLKLWEWSGRKPAEVLLAQRIVWQCAPCFSHDGRRLAAVVESDRGRATVRVWTVGGKGMPLERSAPAGVMALSFSPDDRSILALGADGTLRSWNLNENQWVEIAHVTAGVRGQLGRSPAVFSADGERLLVAHGDGKFALLETSTGETLCEIDLPGVFACAAVSPDGEVVAFGPSFLDDRTAIQLISGRDGQMIGVLGGHLSWVAGLAFTSDGRRLISASADQSLRVWDLELQQEIDALRGHLTEVNCVAAIPDGSLTVSGGKDGTLGVWDLQRHEPTRPYSVLPALVESVSFFPDGAAFLTAGADIVSLWDAATLQRMRDVPELGRGVTSLVISGDGSRVYAGSRSGELRMLEWGTGAAVTLLPAGERGAPLEILNQGATLLVQRDGEILVWDANSGVQRAGWDLMRVVLEPARVLAIAPSEQAVLISRPGGGLEEHELANGNSLRGLPEGEPSVGRAAYSPDGRLIATASGSGRVTLYDTESQQVADVLRGHLLGVHSVSFSPDGQRLASVSLGREAVKLWDVPTRHEVATLAADSGFFSRVAFSPDGQLVVAINTRAQACVWRAPSLAYIDAQSSEHERGLY